MLDVTTKNRINSARDILVGKVPNPISQVQQITFALIYKFMNDMDKQSIELGGDRNFFKGNLEKYSWDNLISNKIEANPALELYSEGLEKLAVAENIPPLFRKMFKNAFIPYRDGVTFKSFIKIIDEFHYSHSEKLGDAFEFLLSILGSQGDAGQFRTPRHIIDFMAELMNPQKNETILDPACGTAGFLISAYKHIIKNNSSNYNPQTDKPAFEATAQSVAEIGYGDENKQYKGDKLKPDERAKLNENIFGYDISPEMVQFSLVNFYLHQCPNPKIFEYDSLTSVDRWNENADVILANPPFMTPKGGIRPHDRFGVKSNRAEVLFVDYIAEHLTLNGRAAIIVPEGVIFQSANAYKDLRKKLIEKSFLVGVISLPAGIFNPYSGVKTSILWLDRKLAKQTDKIFFAKIEADGFDLGAQRRQNNKNDLPAIFKATKEYINSLTNGKDFETGSFKNVSLVEKAKIAENGEYNFSADRYLESKVSNSDYPMVELGEICEFIRGVVYSKEDETDSSNNYKILRANNIDVKSGSLNFEDIKTISETVKLKSEQKLKKDDILICTASGSAEHIGKVAYIEDDINFYFGGFMAAVRVKPSLVSKYLFYFLRDNNFKSYLETAISGANIKNLNSKILFNYKIPLPPLEVQQEIAVEIESYQTIIDAARKITTTYKPRITLNPEWEEVELGEVARIINGRAYKQEELLETGKYRVLRVGNFFTNKNWYYSDLELEDDKYCVNGDLLYAWSASFGPRIWEGEKVIYHYHIWKIEITSKNIDKKYLYYLLERDTESIKSDGGRGIAMVHITKSGIEKRKIALPPLDIQKQIVAEIEAEQQIINANKKLIEIFEAKIHRTISKIWGDKKSE